jgi:hypothetical protein
LRYESKKSLSIYDTTKKKKKGTPLPLIMVKILEKFIERKTLNAFEGKNKV